MIFGKMLILESNSTPPSPNHGPGLCHSPSPRDNSHLAAGNQVHHGLVFQELRVPRNGDPHVGVSPVHVQKYDHSPYR